MHDNTESGSWGQANFCRYMSAPAKERKHFITAKMPRKAYARAFSGSWWVIAFGGLCFLFYSHGAHKKTKVYIDLQQKLQKLQWEKQLAEQDRQDLLLQISSQQDPAWIEMTLMKKLGVVPEGQLKVYFKREE